MIESLERIAISDTVESIETLNGVPASAIRTELDRVLRSRVFVHSHRIRRFLQFVVEECLLGQHHRLKEYLIGLEVFNRLEAFDPRVDSIVRVEARRLRAKLEEYYVTEGRDDEVRIELRKGSYVPVFEQRKAGDAWSVAAQTHPRRRSISIQAFRMPNGHGNGRPHEQPDEACEQITRRLAHVLIKAGHLQVIAPADQPVDGPARENGRADYLLEGSLETRDGSARLLLQLLNVAENSYVWSETADLAAGDGSSLDDMARSLNRAVVTSYAPEAARAPRRRDHRESFDLYLKGRYHWKSGAPDSIRNSITYFSRAVERDPGYAAAWAALAEALVISCLCGLANPGEVGGKIREAAQKAAALDEALPEAHVAMGAVLSLLDWNWADGEQEFQRAIQIDGRDATAHVAYGIQLACRGMMAAAQAEVERALELDPASLSTNFVLGWLHGVCGHYEEAMSQHRLVSQLAPDFPLAYLGLGWAHTARGSYQDAIAHFTNASHLLKCRSLLSGSVGYCHARLNQRDEALRQLTQAAGNPQAISPARIAAIHLGLGEKDRAFACLEDAAAARDCSLPMQLLNPEFNSVRQDSRFTDLLKRMGIHIGGSRPASAV
jgi:tetratricopeptide (TPR) repeat protein